MFDKDLSGSIEGGEIDLMVRGLFSMAGIEFDCEDINNCRETEASNKVVLLFRQTKDSQVELI